HPNPRVNSSCELTHEQEEHRDRGERGPRDAPPPAQDLLSLFCAPRHRADHFKLEPRHRHDKNSLAISLTRDSLSPRAFASAIPSATAAVKTSPRAGFPSRRHSSFRIRSTSFLISVSVICDTLCVTRGGSSREYLGRPTALSIFRATSLVNGARP